MLQISAIGNDIALRGVQDDGAIVIVVTVDRAGSERLGIRCIVAGHSDVGGVRRNGRQARQGRGQ